MSFYDSIYNKAMKTSRNNSDSFQYNYNFTPENSDEVQQNLFFVHNYADLFVRYPYSVSFSPFSSFLILYTKSGQGQITYNNHTYILSPNTFLFLDCNQGFDVNVTGSVVWQYQRLYFNGSYTELLYKQLLNSQLPLYHSSFSSCSSQGFQKLVHYICGADTSPIVLSTLINTFVTSLVLEQTQLCHHISVPRYIVEIQELLNTQYNKTFDLDSLSRLFNVSKNTLSKDFKKYLNVSPIEYLIQQRLNAAKQMLIQTDCTISEIGIQIGIYNATHFIHLFKKRTGVTPLQYRKQMNSDLIVFDTV